MPAWLGRSHHETRKMDTSDPLHNMKMSTCYSSHKYSRKAKTDLSDQGNLYGVW